MSLASPQLLRSHIAPLRGPEQCYSDIICCLLQENTPGSSEDINGKIQGLLSWLSGSAYALQYRHIEQSFYPASS